jgi:hypothetical protein
MNGVGAHMATSMAATLLLVPGFFGSVQDAATAGLQQAAELHSCHEFAGAVIQDGSAFFVTPLTEGQDDRVNFKIVLRPGEKIAAVFHTHPACVRTGLQRTFSVGDVGVAHQLGVPSYLGAIVSGGVEVRRFIYRADPTDLEGTAEGKFVTKLSVR